jgi:predicted Fe-Mo cluster-binding NifX family protein
MRTRIAIPTDDGRTIAAHFGRATHWAVATIEEQSVISFELRSKSGPHAESTKESRHDGHDHNGPEADARHDAMLAPIRGCDAIVARGIGPGARNRVAASGMELVVVTSTGLVAEAARLYAAGRLAGSDSDGGCTRVEARA